MIYIFIDICCFHKFEMSDLLLLLPLLLHHKLQWHLILQFVQANQLLLLSSRWRWWWPWWRRQWLWWWWCCLWQLWWKTLLRWLTMPAPMESPRTLIAVRNLKENIILGSKNIYHHPQPGCKHYDDSYWYDDGDVCRPIKQPVHREDDGDRLTGKSNLMRVSLTLKLFNPIAFFLLGNFYMIILSCATHCVENHDHSNKPCLKGLS